MSGNLRHRTDVGRTTPLTPESDRAPFRSAIISGPINRPVADGTAYNPSHYIATRPMGNGTEQIPTINDEPIEELVDRERASDLQSSSGPVTRQQANRTKHDRYNHHPTDIVDNNQQRLPGKHQNNDSLRNTDDTYSKIHSDVKGPPLETLPSLINILKVIPHHCLKSSLLQSMYYVVKDIIMMAILFYIGTWIYSCSLPLRLAVSPFYWFAQGTLFFSIFVLGHECGHGSFSRYPALNTIMGTILHTFVLTPYFPWKISHRHHHSYTGNMEKDEIFYPIRKKDDTGRKYVPLFGLGFAWFAYLWRGFEHSRPLNHWNPWDRMFRDNFWECLSSIVAIVIWLGTLFFYSSWELVTFHYVMPIIVCATYIVVVTFLHHNDLNVPWYSDDYWGRLEGSLSTVDRDYGLNHDIIHTIGTHQIHHLFPFIPHYKLREATRHFRKEFPQLVHVNNDGIFTSFWKTFFIYNNQGVVPDDTKIHIYT